MGTVALVSLLGWLELGCETTSPQTLRDMGNALVATANALDAASPNAQSTQPGSAQTPRRASPPGADSRASGLVALGFESAGDLFECGPGDQMTLDAGESERRAMRWQFDYRGQWHWCSRSIPAGSLSGALTTQLLIRSDRPDDFFVQLEEQGGEAFFTMVSPGTAWTPVMLELAGLAVDPKKRQDGVLNPARISKILVADSQGTTGVLGKRTIWFADWVFMAAAGTVVPATAPSAAVPRGARRLGMHLSEADDHNFDAVVRMAKTAGVASVNLAINWDEIEHAPGSYSNPFLSIANAYYPAQSLSVDLILRPMDTNGRHVPGDLRQTRFDDSVMIERFKRLLDYVFSQIPSLQLNVLGIGNEVDAGLGDDPSAWEQYRVFYEAVARYARAQRAGMRVGVVGTFDGLTRTAVDRLKQLNEHSDAILVTYYPLHGDFTVKDPSVVANDFRMIVDLYPSQPIFFTEVGYPSSPLNGSSQTQQAAFVRAVFRAWDAHPDRMPYIALLGLTDASEQAVDEWHRYYGSNAPRFLAYLGSLGLRTYPGRGSDKEAFRALQVETRARGW